MHLFHILDENLVVCRNHILSFLDLNDLLRLRRVCKFTNTVSTGYIRRKHQKRRRPLEIDGSDGKGMKFVVGSDLSIGTSAHFLNLYHMEGSRRLEASVKTCLKTWAPNLTHLKITNVKFPLNSNEFKKFFESFPKLSNLEVDLGALPWNPSSSLPSKHQIPSTFKNLKLLAILNLYNYHSETLERLLPFILEMVAASIANLEHVSLPLQDPSQDYALYALCNMRNHGYHGWDEEERDSILRFAVRLACICLFNSPNLKTIKGLNGAMVSRLLSPDNRTPEMGSVNEMTENLNAKIVSIIDPTETTFQLLELPNLEEMDLADMGYWGYPDSYKRIMKLNWPHLKNIRAHLSDENETLENIWDSLFVGIVRDSVVKLDISHDSTNEDETFVRTMDIPASCPNLKSLRIGYDFIRLVNLAEFSGFWRGLPYLEKLVFDYCSGLNDAHFVGKDAQNPAFCSLKRLKVLRFSGMGRMQITDDLFRQVIRHMPLKELDLNNDDAKDSLVTLKGIKSLLLGQFAGTIERLSIERIRLPGVTKEQLKNVERMFRSSQMI